MSEPEVYGTYDPREISPVVSDGIIGRDEELEDPTLLDENGDALPKFDDRYKEDFVGLTFLGALTKEFTWLGHKFLIRTLTQEESLLVPILIKKWAGTAGELRAYTTAIAALCTISVDGQELPIPIGNDRDEYAWAYQKLSYALKNWYAYTVDAVYNHYMSLEYRAAAVVEAMGKALGSQEPTPGLNDN